MNTRARRTKGERGGALVEFALLNIVLVPLLLYSVFLMDAAYMKLDLQETVVSGVWDWTTRNTEPSGNGSHSSIQAAERDKTMQMVRLIYSDHTSAFDDGAEPGRDGYNQQGHLRSSVDHQKHHTGFGAQYTFLFGGTDTQFQCEIDDEDLSWNLDPNFSGFGKSAYSAGGRVSCYAEACIYNYIMPEEFLQEFSQTEVSPLLKRDGDAHSIQCGGGANANIRLKETAALSFNTWAITNGGRNAQLSSADIGAPSGFTSFMNVPNGTDGNNPFYKRVHEMTASTGIFTATHAAAIATATAFTAKAAQERIMVVIPTAPAGQSLGPLPPIVQTRLIARYQPEASQKAPIRTKPPGLLAGFMHQGFQSTPFERVNDDYKTAAKKRRGYYLGCNTAERSVCN